MVFLSVTLCIASLVVSLGVLLHIHGLVSLLVSPFYKLECPVVTLPLSPSLPSSVFNVIVLNIYSASI